MTSQKTSETPPPSAGETPDFLCFDTVAHDYDLSRGLPPEVQHRLAAFVRDQAGLKPGQPLLDAGVGTGRFALPLAQLGVPVVGVDISANMMRHLLRKREEAEHEAGGESALPLRLARGDLRRLPLASGVFGAVLFVHILHLIADWQAVLDEARRALAPGGALLFVERASAGQGSAAHDYFRKLASERNLLRPTLGVGAEEINAYLAATGADILPRESGDLTWTSRRPLSLTLDLLRRRTWSSLWEVSDADIETLVDETRAWALEHYGALDVVEEGEAHCRLRLARWPI